MNRNGIIAKDNFPKGITVNLDKLARIDLNLLVILQVLIEEQSVTRAASRLNLSQSALSKSLNRLRNTLEDPLFQRSFSWFKTHCTCPCISQNVAQRTPRLIPNHSAANVYS